MAYTRAVTASTPGSLRWVQLLVGHRLHGDDRQPAIRLDVVCRSDEQGARLADSRHPNRLQHLRRARDMAHADRGLDRRSSGSATRPEVDGCAGGILIGIAWVINAHADSLAVLYLGAVLIRRRRRRNLRDLRRKRGEMVSRPARSRCRLDGRGLWCGCRSDSHPDTRRHRRPRLRGGVFLVRHRSGGDRVFAGAG